MTSAEEDAGEEDTAIESEMKKDAFLLSFLPRSVPSQRFVAVTVLCALICHPIQL